MMWSITSGTYSCSMDDGLEHWLGSGGHEQSDAYIFTAWGADYLKVHFFFRPFTPIPAHTRSVRKLLCGEPHHLYRLHSLHRHHQRTGDVDLPVTCSRSHARSKCLVYLRTYARCTQYYALVAPSFIPSTNGAFKMCQLGTAIQGIAGQSRMLHLYPLPRTVVNLVKWWGGI